MQESAHCCSRWKANAGWIRSKGEYVWSTGRSDRRRKIAAKWTIHKRPRKIMKGQKGPEKITQHFGHVVKGDEKSSKTFQPKRIGGIWMHWVDHEYQWMDRWIPFSLGSDESVNLILRKSDGSKQAGKMSVNLRLRNSDGSKLIRQRLFVAHFALACLRLKTDRPPVEKIFFRRLFKRCSKFINFTLKRNRSTLLLLFCLCYRTTLF